MYASITPTETVYFQLPINFIENTFLNRKVKSVNMAHDWEYSFFIAHQGESTASFQ